MRLVVERARRITLNDVPLVWDDLSGGYVREPGTLDDLGPDSTLTIVAIRKGITKTLVLECPSEVTLTEPTAGTAVAAGDTITVAWSGNITYDTLFKPSAKVVGFDSANELVVGFASGSSRATLEGTSVELTVPTLTNAAADSYVVEVEVPGALVQELDEDVSGYCTLVHHTRLEVN